VVTTINWEWPNEYHGRTGGEFMLPRQPQGSFPVKYDLSGQLRFAYLLNKSMKVFELIKAVVEDASPKGQKLRLRKTSHATRAIVLISPS
jgi:hypothetical protein